MSSTNQLFVWGGYADGYKAVAIALTHGLPVSNLRRYWSIIDHELVGSEWELTTAFCVPRTSSHGSSFEWFRF